MLADPNPSRLEVRPARVGAARTIEIARGGGQAAAVREQSAGGKGFWIAVDCTGQPGVWSDAIESVRPGGLVNLFGGCAPGTSIPLDTHLVHYSELTLKGVYHHRPETFRRAIALLADPSFRADLLISGMRPIGGVVEALRKHDPQGSAEGRHPQLDSGVTTWRRARGDMRNPPLRDRRAIFWPMRKTQIILPAAVAVALTLVAAILSRSRSAETVARRDRRDEAWARATPPGADVGAVYLTIENKGGAADRLMAVTSPAAQSAMLHRDRRGRRRQHHAPADGSHRAGATLDMKPGGAHIMLMGLKAPLKEGETVDVTLTFEKAGEVKTTAKVQALGADTPHE